MFATAALCPGKDVGVMEHGGQQAWKTCRDTTRLWVRVPQESLATSTAPTRCAGVTCVTTVGGCPLKHCMHRGGHWGTPQM